MQPGFFTENRKRLIDTLPGGLFIITAYTQMQRLNDMAALFEQESNFWYLTGITEPDWQLIIDGSQGMAWLVAPHVEKQHELFDGSLTNKKATEISGIYAVVGPEDADSLLRKLAKKHSVAYTIDQPSYVSQFNFSTNPALLKLRQKLERIFPNVQSCNKEITKLRAIKSSEEVKAIEKAVNLTASAFTKVYENIQNYHYEYQIEADITQTIRFNGASGHAYDPIVAAGQNACTLHYTNNTAKLRKHQFVLIDIGARLSGYAADITRTYALGTPSKRQQAIHLKVTEAQREIIALLGPNLSVEEYHKKVLLIMGTALAELGLVNSPSDEKVYTYFPHAISHGLGVDVHDELGRPRFLEPGMVLTVEPGIYIPEEGIGVRIEDDILITEKGHRNLSSSLSTGW